MPDDDTAMTEDEARQVRADSFYAHEVLDRAHLAANFFSDNVVEHPFVQATPRLRKAAEELAEQLAEFYQEVGRVEKAED